MSLRLQMLFVLLIAWSPPLHGASGVADAPSWDYANRCGTLPITIGNADHSSIGVARPPIGTFQLGSGHFIIHYNDASAAVYAQTISDAAELAWRVLLDTLVYETPPSDAPAGGDSRTDIYVLAPAQIPGVRGRTIGETQVGVPHTNTFTAYIEIVDTLGTALLETVAAHELFHVVQFGYDAAESSSWLELLSTWIEDRVFDPHNQYLEVLPGFFSRPQKGFFSHVYSNVPFAFYLTENYGDTVLREIMDECAAVPGSNIRPALDAALAGYSTSFTEELQTFGQWNFFTGARDDGAHYEEGGTWPEIEIEKRTDCYPMPRYDTTNKCDPWGANYYLFDGNGYTDSLRIWFLPEYFANSMMSVTKFEQGTPSEYLRETFGPLTIDSFMVDNWRDCDSLLIVYHYNSSNPPIGSFRVSAYFPETSVPRASWILILDRDACARPFDGVGDEFARRDGEEKPFRDALAALGAPFVLSYNLPSNLTACRAVFIVGGYGDAGLTLSEPELTRLMTYMDGGGGVYLEGRRFGEWTDPGLGMGSAIEQAFWAHFGATFVPGDTMTTGNVSLWTTRPPIGAFGFAYDATGRPDNFVGSLVPGTADTLATDQSGDVRMTIAYGPGNAKWIHSTILLGGSTGNAPGSTREAYVQALMDLYGVTVAALAVTQMNVTRNGQEVTISGELAGFAGQNLRLERTSPGHRQDVALRVDVSGTRARVLARDTPPSGEITYRMYTDDWLLWEQTLTSRRAPVALALVVMHPNPARDVVSLTVEVQDNVTAEFGIYDVSGRRVYHSRRSLAAGVNLVRIAEPSRLAAGVYFVRVTARGIQAQRKLVIVR